MNVGWVGLGKLGLPCALALGRYGEHLVIGYDVNHLDVDSILRGEVDPPREEGIEELLVDHRLKLVRSIHEVVELIDNIVFVAVQTPHRVNYGGEIIVPEEPQNFEYSYLESAVRAIVNAAEAIQHDVTIAIVSTVLPGTIHERIEPLLSARVHMVYNPFFIAMGTTIDDFTHPEFVLLGVREGEHARGLAQLYRELHEGHVPICVLNVESAELLKIAYNTFISQKIVFANTLMEICDKIGGDVDEVIDVLSLATQRVISTAYLRGGMGDGGACHPRDNVAMSWLARKLNLSVDPFNFVTRAREAQCAWLASEVRIYADVAKLPVVVLGKSYKPESNLTFGSPAALLVHLLRNEGVGYVRWWDPYVDNDESDPPHQCAVYVIATRHRAFRDYPFPPGSVVIDPHRYVNVPDDVRLVRIGSRP